MPTKIPIFYHCQTDRTRGPPIEIAWAFVGPDKLGVVSETHLIRPPPLWAPEIKSDSASALSRGIALSDLRKFGTTTRRIAMRMNHVAKSREFFAAHLSCEAVLKRIFETAEIEPAFDWPKSDAETLVRELARLRRVTDRTLALNRRKAELLLPMDGRPETRARYLAMLCAAIVGLD